MDKILIAENIRKHFSMGKNRVEVLKEINLSIDKGSSVAIIGPSGAGKSTLLHVLGLLSTPNEGRMMINGKDISALKEKEKAKLRNKYIGFVFQFHYLLPEFNIIENIIMPALISKEVNYDLMREQAVKTAVQVGLQDRLEHRPPELSGGEQQRVAVARAIVNNPELVLADEPTGNLDSETAEMVGSLMHNLCKKNNKTLVVVTHNENLAKKMDKIFYLKDGRIVS